MKGNLHVPRIQVELWVLEGWWFYTQKTLTNLFSQKPKTFDRKEMEAVPFEEEKMLDFSTFLEELEDRKGTKYSKFR